MPFSAQEIRKVMRNVAEQIVGRPLTDSEYHEFMRRIRTEAMKCSQ